MHDTNAHLPPLVDFHCHLDLYPKHREIVEECERKGIKTLSVTNAPSVWPRNKNLVSSCAHVRVALGLHPQLAGEREQELDLFERYLGDARYVGEVGLDGSPEFSSTWQVQLRVFQRILELCAEQGSKILTIHSRRASKDVVDMIRTLLPKERGRAVLHWFSGTVKEARLAADAGCYFSVNVRMLASERGQQLVASFPKERVLTETDGPFITCGDRPLTPKDVANVASELSILWGMETNGVIQLVAKNLYRLLS